MSFSKWQGLGEKYGICFSDLSEIIWWHGQQPEDGAVYYYHTLTGEHYSYCYLREDEWCKNPKINIEGIRDVITIAMED